VDKRDTEHEFGKMLLKEIAITSLELANQLCEQLEATEFPLTMEQLLVRLEENERLMEILEVESTAANKGGVQKHRIRKVNNLWQIQQFNSNQSAHPAEVKTIFHTNTQCPKEKARLQKEAKQRGEKLPGPERSSKHGNHQPDKNKLQKQETMTLDAFSVSHLE
jgi:hypothetical protein